MSKQDKIKLLLATFFFGLGIIFSSLAIQNYQVRTQTRADDTESLDINLANNTSLGVLDTSFGFILPDITNTTLVDEINNTFNAANRDSVDKSVLIKLVNPTVDTIKHANFQKLQTNGFRWYLSFPNFTNVEAVLSEYYKTNTSEVVVEITNYDNFDVTKIDPILTTYPKVKFHAAEFTFWPREQVKELLLKVQPPKLNAVSIKTLVNGNASVKDDVLLMFDTFWDASSDVAGNSNIEINYPANSKLSLSDIQTKVGGDVNQEQARRYGIISSALMSGIATQGANDKAPIEYVIAGDYSKMSILERQMLLSYAHLLHNRPNVIWPNLTSSNGNAARQIDPVIGMTAFKDSNYFGIITNITGNPVTLNLTDNTNLSTYKTLSNQKGPGDMITNENTIVLQGYETVYFFPASSWTGLQTGGTSPTPTGSTSGTPFPTFPPIPTQAKGALLCDPGPDPYNSSTITVYNDTGQTLDDLVSYVHRCKYEEGKIKKGFYKCETSASCDPNDENCDPGVWDQAASQDFSLAPGATKVLTMNVNPCQIAQLDVYNADVHQDDTVLECTNIRSQHTVDIGKRWPGGIGFAIGSNPATYPDGTCNPPPATPTPTTPPSVPTSTPNPSNTPVPTNTPSPLPTNTPAPTNTPFPTNTVIPTNTPAPTNSPMPTYTPIPTYTPYPTNTPITKLEVNEQPPGITPWAIIAVPIGLILIGLLF